VAPVCGDQQLIAARAEAGPVGRFQHGDEAAGRILLHRHNLQLVMGEVSDRGAQLLVEVWPAQADSGLLRHLAEPQVEEALALRRLDDPAGPGQRDGAHRGMARGQVEAQRLHRVRPTIEARPRLVLAAGRHAVEDVDGEAGLLHQHLRQHAAGDAAADDAYSHLLGLTPPSA
jgi:hypothetical protein